MENKLKKGLGRGLSSLLEDINDLSLKNKQKITIPFLRENFFK